MEQKLITVIIEDAEGVVKSSILERYLNEGWKIEYYTVVPSQHKYGGPQILLTILLSR